MKTMNKTNEYITFTLQDEEYAIGGIVDSVKEVIEITEDMIQEAPKVGIRIKSNYISGIAKHNEKFVIILDINKVLSEDQLAIVEDENLLLTEDSEEETSEKIEIAVPEN